jgi:hypothetical protein
MIETKVPPDVLDRFEVHSYRSAVVVLTQAQSDEFADLLSALRSFSLTTDMIRRAGGNESEIPKLLVPDQRP